MAASLKEMNGHLSKTEATQVSQQAAISTLITEVVEVRREVGSLREMILETQRPNYATWVGFGSLGITIIVAIVAGIGWGFIRELDRSVKDSQKTTETLQEHMLQPCDPSVLRELDRVAMRLQRLEDLRLGETKT